ncbi:MAG TPA: DUF6318 family protein [Flexivirga sp.]|uniref:DUF6318 family protein n=1 Tax=Flexivirga sp. TaxID=1962927 RepID=UPI002B736925|nr:DUF6318 family protein [Flexivirga sp.]HWC22735.1 DUF6318 family protein [Flexivirga sp.]
MYKVSGIGAAVAIAAAMAVSGCSDGSTTRASMASPTRAKNDIVSGRSTPSNGFTATSSSASSSASTKAAPMPHRRAAGAQRVPEQARQHTTAGAVAFARHYWDTVNRTAVRPKVGELDKLASSSCKTCRNFAETVRTNVENGWRFDGPEGTIAAAEPRGESVWMKINPIDGALVNQNTGALVKDYPTDEPYVWVFSLEWTSQGWKVTSMRVADASLW